MVLKRNIFPLLVFALIFLMSSCKKDSDKPEHIEHVSIANSDTYTYNTGYCGDEQGAYIYKQAKNFEISEVKRDSLTSYCPVYFYKAKVDFVGKDTVDIKCSNTEYKRSKLVTKYKITRLIITVNN